MKKKFYTWDECMQLREVQVGHDPLVASTLPRPSTLCSRALLPPTSLFAVSAISHTYWMRAIGRVPLAVHPFWSRSVHVFKFGFCEC